MPEYQYLHNAHWRPPEISERQIKSFMIASSIYDIRGIYFSCFKVETRPDARNREEMLP